MTRIVLLLFFVGASVLAHTNENENGARSRLSTTTKKPLTTKRINGIGAAMVMLNSNNKLMSPAVANYPKTSPFPKTTVPGKLLGSTRFPNRRPSKLPGFPTLNPVVSSTSNLSTLTAAFFTESSTSTSTSTPITTPFDYPDISVNETLPDGIIEVDDDADNDSDALELSDLGNTEVTPPSTTTSRRSISVRPTRPGGMSRGTRVTKIRVSKSTTTVKDARPTKPSRSTKAQRTTKPARSPRPSRSTTPANFSRTTRATTTRAEQIVRTSRNPFRVTRNSTLTQLRRTRTTPIQATQAA